MKTVLKDDFDELIIDTNNDTSSIRSSAIAKKTSLTLKITLTRLDNLINEVHTTVEPDQRAEIINFLMGVRIHVHSLIDESIRFRNKLKSQH